MISPESISAILVTTRFMNSRSCEVIRSVPGKDLRNCSSQMMDSMSRWLVGSSMSSTSGRPSRTRARATRIFQPPESAPTSPSIWSSCEAEAVQDLAGLRLRARSRPDARILPAPRRSAPGCGPGSSAWSGSSMARWRSSSSWCRIAGASAARDGFVERGAAAHLLDILAEIADGEAFGNGDFAVVGLLPRRRSCGTAWFCRSRWGRPGRLFRRG